MPTAVRILLVSGSTRSGSTNTAALRTLGSVTPEGVSAELYQGMADLPNFIPTTKAKVCAAGDVADAERSAAAAV